MDSESPIAVRVILLFLNACSFVYDLLMYPYFFFVENIRRTRRFKNFVQACPVVESDPSTPYRSADYDSLPHFLEYSTLDDIFRAAVKLRPNENMLGTRELLKEELELQIGARKVKKYVFGDYYWETYQQIDERVDDIGYGLIGLGLAHRSQIIMFAETRAEWLIVALACFRYNFPIVTLYPTLGDDGIIHGINECEATCIFTTETSIQKILKLMSKLPRIEQIIFLNDGIDHGKLPRQSNHAENPFKIHAIRSIESLGRRTRYDVTNFDLCSEPKANDVAVIMYTSGSTGVPKGVEMTHGNFVAAVCGVLPRIPITSEDTYIGYLPLAHVLELAAEIACIVKGTRIGYSSPMTLSDSGINIKKGTSGDAKLLKPTLMATVPLIFDRIRKTVFDAVSKSNPLNRAIFEWGYKRKRKLLLLGRRSPILDSLIFQKIRDQLGGHLRMVMAGGAPLSEETQKFIEIVFCPVIQGYGLTETCGVGALMNLGSLQQNSVGPPISCCEISLIDWPEGGYSPHDKPYPRGEILVCGENIARGYYKQPDKTSESFFSDQHGKRWLRTGDIGMFNDQGNLSIIDRKKDIVKLQSGEYVSLGKIEMILKESPLVESACACGKSTKNFIVCLIVPNQQKLMKLAKNITPRCFDIVKVCKKRQVIAEVLKQLRALASFRNLHHTEYPRAIRLCSDQWTPETGLVTSTFKLKRKEIEMRFREDINDMFLDNIL